LIYLWVKSFHIIAVVAWVAALLVYPRYKLHQLASSPGEPLFERMKKASGQLRRIIMIPGLIATWVFGLSLIALNPAIASSKWLWVKLLLVIVISGLHSAFTGIGKKIDAADGSVQEKRLRMMNELPFVLFAAIVILVVVRPF